MAYIRELNESVDRKGSAEREGSTRSKPHIVSFFRTSGELHLAIPSLNNDTVLIESSRVRVRIEYLSNTFDES